MHGKRAKQRETVRTIKEATENAGKQMECGIFRSPEVFNAMIHLRLACTGAKVGPSLYDLMAVLGRERVLARLDRALAQMHGA